MRASCDADLGMLRPHLIDMRDAGGITRGQAIPEHGVFGLVMQVQGEEVELRVVPDDRGTLRRSPALDRADEQRQLAVEPAEDAMHEDQT